jgi:hypothetical protein
MFLILDADYFLMNFFLETFEDEEFTGVIFKLGGAEI